MAKTNECSCNFHKLFSRLMAQTQISDALCSHYRCRGGVSLKGIHREIGENKYPTIPIRTVRDKSCQRTAFVSCKEKTTVVNLRARRQRKHNTQYCHSRLNATGLLRATTRNKTSGKWPCTRRRTHETTEKTQRRAKSQIFT